jgi:serine/threonine protein kinase
MPDRFNKKSKAVQKADEQTAVTEVPCSTEKSSEDPTIPPVPSVNMITPPSDHPKPQQFIAAPSDFVMEPGIPAELAKHPDYEVIRPLGRGGMGVVYLAKNRIMGRLEVLKVINKSLMDRPQMVERFLQEIRSAAQLNHSNIVTAYTALRLGDLLALAMEYVEGENLAELVEVRGPLPVLNACYYIQQAAQGLQHACDKGMVHRDIKPGNLMLARAGKRHTIKILDFGLAKATSEKAQPLGESPQGGLTIEGIMLGTPEFVAPEQILDARKADIRADIYSLGCTLYYLLAGKAPFRGSSLFEVLQAHQSSQAIALDRLRPDVPAELAAVVAKMLAKDPARRYQRPVEIVKALAPFVKPGSAIPTREDIKALEKPSSPRTAVRGQAQPGNRTPALPSRSAAPPARSSMPPDTKADVWEDIGDVTPVPVTGQWKSPFQSERFHLWFWPSVGVSLAIALAIGFWAAGAFRGKIKDAGIDATGSPEGIGRVPRPEPSKGVDSVDASSRPWSAPAPHDGFVPLFNGKDLSGWSIFRDDARSWRLQNGHVVESSAGYQTAGVLFTHRRFSNYRLRLEYKVDPGANCRFVPRFREEDSTLGGTPFQAGLLLIDDDYMDSHPGVGNVGARTGAFVWGRHGSDGVPRDQPADLKPVAGWNLLEVEVQDQVLSARVNGKPVQRIHLDFLASRPNAFFGLKQTNAPIGLSGHTGTVRFRNIEVLELSGEAASKQEPGVLAVLSHRPGLGNPGRIRLFANGHVNSPTSPDTWELKGDTLTFRWVNNRAPGGVWVDTCKLTDNGRTYAGMNQLKNPVSGANLTDGDLGQLLRRTN